MASSPSNDDAKRWNEIRETISGLTSYYNSDDEEAERKEAEVYRSQNILLALDAANLMEKAKLRPPNAVLTCFTGSVDFSWSSRHGGVTCDFGIDPEDADGEVTIFKNIGGLAPRFVSLPFSIGNKEQWGEILRFLSLFLDELYPSATIVA